MLRSSFLRSFPSRVLCVRCHRTSRSSVTCRKRQREVNRLHCNVLPQFGGPNKTIRSGSRASSKWKKAESRFTPRGSPLTKATPSTRPKKRR